MSKEKNMKHKQNGFSVAEITQNDLNINNLNSNPQELGFILNLINKFLNIISISTPVTVTVFGICFIFFIISLPGKLCHLLYPAFRLLFGNLYPAYASYKAVRTKNVREYVKWMMYWIIFAIFRCIETFTDIFFSWFPFYYEVKICIVIWLLLPATKGSTILFRKFVHPMLSKRENEIDEYISRAKEKGYTAVLQFGSQSVNYATNVIMQTAIKYTGLKPMLQNITTSHSDNELYLRRSDSDETDHPIQDGESRMRRSQSVDSALLQPKRYNLRKTPDVIYEGISSDDDIHYQPLSEILGSPLTDSCLEPEKVKQPNVSKKTKSTTGVRGRKPIKRGSKKEHNTGGGDVHLIEL